MKKNLLNTLAATTCLSLASMAQPSITASGVNPIVGDAYNTKVCNYVQPGSGGANATWDFSTMTANGNANYVSSNPSSTPYAASFGSSNFCMNNGTAIYSFWNASSTALQNTGSVVQGTTLSYSDPEDILHFPFNDGDVYTDTWSCTFVSNSITYVRTGTTTVVYSGYGTLKLPTGTYQNAVRVQFGQIYTDTYSGGTINYQNDEYLWYVNGHHQAIAATYTFDNDISGMSSSAMYSTGSVTGIFEAGNTLSNIDVYPNPASDKITISAPKELKLKEVQICDITGKLQLVETSDAFGSGETTDISLNHLNNGIYIVKFIAEDGSIGIKKITISK